MHGKDSGNCGGASWRLQQHHAGSWTRPAGSWHPPATRRGERPPGRPGQGSAGLNEAMAGLAGPHVVQKGVHIKVPLRPWGAVNSCGAARRAVAAVPAAAELRHAAGLDGKGRRLCSQGREKAGGGAPAQFWPLAPHDGEVPGRPPTPCHHSLPDRGAVAGDVWAAPSRKRYVRSEPTLCREVPFLVQPQPVIHELLQNESVVEGGDCFASCALGNRLFHLASISNAYKCTLVRPPTRFLDGLRRGLGRRRAWGGLRGRWALLRVRHLVTGRINAGGSGWHGCSRRPLSRGTWACQRRARRGSLGAGAHEMTHLQRSHGGAALPLAAASPHSAPGCLP